MISNPGPRRERAPIQSLFPNPPNPQPPTPNPPNPPNPQSPTPNPHPLLLRERDDRIDARRAPRGNVAGGKRDDDERGD